AVAFPLGGNVIPSNVPDLPIADEQFAVVADVEPAERQRIEPPHFPSRFSQRLPKTVQQRDRAEGIDERSHADTTKTGANQSVAEPLADGRGHVNVALHFDGGLRGVDRGQHLGKRLVTGAQPAKPNGVGRWHCTEIIGTPDKLQLSGWSGKVLSASFHRSTARLLRRRADEFRDPA